MAEAKWTADHISTLKTLWGSGMSATEVADAMACGYTRNAVISKVSALKLPKRLATGAAAQRRAPPTTNGQPKISSVASIAAKRSAVSNPLGANISRLRKDTAQQPEPFDMEDGDGVDVTALLGIMELTPHTCRWPHGDPLLPGFGYCGKHVSAKGPYCGAHALRAGLGYGRGPRP